MKFIQKYFIIILLLFSFSLLSCGGEEETADPPANNGPQETNEQPEGSADINPPEGVLSSESTFTITVTDDSEYVYLYYSEQVLAPNEKQLFFILNKDQCLNITESQFQNLLIYVSNATSVYGRSESSATAETVLQLKGLCTVAERCAPGHYEIVNDEERWYSWFADQFILQSVEQANNSGECVAITEWMKAKVTERYNEIQSMFEENILTNPTLPSSVVGQYKEWVTP